MITVTIGSAEKSLPDATKGGWVAEQFERRGREGDKPCVRVRIQEPGVDIVVSTPNCPTGPSSGRSATSKEQEIFDLWEKRGLRKNDFNQGGLQAFLRQLAQMF